MERPTDALLKTTLNRKGALVRRIREFKLYSRRRIRQNEWFPDFEILDDKWAPFEKLHASFERHLDKCGSRKNYMILDLVIFQEGHVSSVEPDNPGGHCTWQAGIKQASATRREAPVACLGNFVPPPALLPCVGGQGEEMPRGCHGGKVERNPRAVQIHSGLESGFEFVLSPDRGDDGGFGCPGRQAFLDGMRKRGMRV